MAPTVDQLDLDFDPFSEEMLVDPYPVYRRLREHAPVYYNRTREFWAVSCYEEARIVLRDHETFSSADGPEFDGTSVEFFGPKNFLAMDPPDHAVIRKVMAPAFRPVEIKRLIDAVSRVGNELIDRFIDNGHADFAQDYGWPLPIEMISIMLGVPNQDRAWVSEVVLKAFRRDIGEAALPTAALEAAEQVRSYFAAAALDRRRSPEDDLLTRMSDGEVYGERMTPEEIGGLCLFLFAAGIITTGSFLSNSFNLLSKDPVQRARLTSELSIMPRAVEELLRLESPVQNMVRTATKDVVLGGEQIHRGDKVAVFPGSVNRDERVWENSEALDFDRPQIRSQVFGDGVHFCLGVHLARLEGRAGLTCLLSRIPDFEVAGEITRTDRVSERGIVALPVTF